MKATLVHVNLIADDWKALAKFLTAATGARVTWYYVTDPEGT